MTAAGPKGILDESAVVGPSKPRLWQVLGPGLITGAADDDPSGIATYSQAGAQFGFSLAWTLLVSYPLMVVIQVISARIGRTTGRPIAGDFAFALFALGIIGTGILSVPVLAGSAAYALGEARRWPVGLARQPQQAKAFYATIAAATLLGAGANVLSISPVKALVWSAVLNAIVAVPVMALIMRIATNGKIMGQFKITGPWSAVGWLATAIMGAASIVFLTSLITPGG